MQRLGNLGVLGIDLNLVNVVGIFMFFYFMFNEQNIIIQDECCSFST